MESAISLKFRLYPNAEQSYAFSELCQGYANACNFASQYVFDNGMITSAIDLSLKSVCYIISHLETEVNTCQGCIILKNSTSLSNHRTAPMSTTHFRPSLFESTNPVTLYPDSAAIFVFSSVRRVTPERSCWFSLLTGHPF